MTTRRPFPASEMWRPQSERFDGEHWNAYQHGNGFDSAYGDDDPADVLRPTWEPKRGPWDRAEPVVLTEHPPEPPYPAARCCVLCTAVLSRYHGEVVCWPCQRRYGSVRSIARVVAAVLS